VSAIIVFSKRWLGLAKAYQVSIDGRDVGALSRHRRLSCEVTPGRHTITVSFNGHPSAPLPVDMDENDDAYIELKFGPGVVTSVISGEDYGALLLSRAEQDYSAD
jgi:hypothetical protein